MICETITSTKTIDLCDKFKIPYVKIKLGLDEKGKKTRKGNGTSGWKKWDYEKCMNYNKSADPKCNGFDINLSTSKTMVVDFDSEEAKKYMEECGGNVWVSKSSQRGMPHLWRVKDENDKNGDVNDWKPKVDLRYSNIFESLDSVIENTDKPMPIFKNYPEVKKKEKKETKKKTTQTILLNKKSKKINEEQKAILDNINDKYWIQYDTWRNMIWALYNEFGDIDLCDEYSKKGGEKYKGIEDVQSKIISDKSHNFGFGTICEYSKQSNRNKFIEIKSKYTPIFFSNSDWELCDAYLKVVGDSVVYNKDDETLYIFQDGFWRKDEKKELIKRDMRTQLYPIFEYKLNHQMKLNVNDEGEQDKRARNIKRITASINCINTSSKQKSIIEQIPLILDKKDYKFDCLKPNYFCFNNVCFDLKKREPIQIDKYDYITLNTGYDWIEPLDEEVAKINKFLNEIQPNKKILDCVLSVLRRGLYGKQEECFVMFNGDGGNGKGVLLELFQEILGIDYFYSGHNEILTTPIKGGANVELSQLHLKRCAVYSEPPEGKKLQSSTIKQLSGNPYINARGLYSSNTRTILHQLMILECNERPAISGRSDKALLRRIMDIYFPMNFVATEEDIINPETDRLRDESFKDVDFKDKHKFALFKIIFESKYENLYVPAEVKERGNQFLFDNDDLLNFIQEKYEFTTDNSQFIKVIDLYNIFKKSDIFSNFTKEERRNEWSKSKFTEKIKSSICLSRFYKDRKKINQKEYRSILVNYKEKPEDTAEQLENDENTEFEEDNE